MRCDYCYKEYIRLIPYKKGHFCSKCISIVTLLEKRDRLLRSCVSIKPLDVFGIF